MGEKCIGNFMMENTMFDDWKNEIPFSTTNLSKPSLALIQVNESSVLNGRVSSGKNITCKEDCRVYPNSLNQGCIKFEGARRRYILKKYCLLFENSPDIFLLIDLQGNILEGNKAALAAYGFTREELNTMKVRDLRTAETRGLIKQQIHEAYHNGIVFETEHVRKNGERFPVEVRSFRFETILLSCVQDISRRRQGEAEALKNESIKVIGKVAAGLAHEIRNTISGVHGFLQLAEDGVISPEQFLENAGFMLEELNHANFVISELILTDPNRCMNLEIKNLNQIIIGMSPALQTIAMAQGKTLDIHLEELPEILLDEFEIQKLIRNLINNALESLDKGGQVSIRTCRDVNALSLIIRDNGSGINTDIINQLGTPFLTTKKNRIGLGLVICQSIVIRHNADITIESNPLGTNIRVRFNIPPAAEQHRKPGLLQREDYD
ncbi:PAS domain S-box [Desulfosporosinus orientis DSM 765]|uniref:histidine kinase n=2 Tax=Desulfosporosinus orientis TaxID=1563 RepID=G7WE93_DESOD|nr:PAS domain S-box [Desulfosporosinus orientis DSM 765]